MVALARTGLWILPDPWTTPTPRRPPVLGRRIRRAAHRLHRLCNDGDRANQTALWCRRYAPGRL